MILRADFKSASGSRRDACFPAMKSLLDSGLLYLLRLSLLPVYVESHVSHLAARIFYECDFHSYIRNVEHGL